MQTNLNESKSARSHYSKSDEGEAFRGLSSRSFGNKFGKNLSRIQSGSLCPFDFSIIPKILSSVTVGQWSQDIKNSEMFTTSCFLDSLTLEQSIVGALNQMKE